MCMAVGILPEVVEAEIWRFGANDDDDWRYGIGSDVHA